MAIAKLNFSGGSTPTNIVDPVKEFLTGMHNKIVQGKKDALAAEDRKYLLDQRARTVTAQDKKLASDRALKEYAKQPMQTSTMLGSQRNASDKAIIDAYDKYNTAVDDVFTLKGYGSTNEAANQLSPEAFQKIISDAGIKDITGVDTSTGLQQSYERATPFRKDVESKLLTDLLSKGVDVDTAKAYAKTEGSRYRTVADRQKSVDDAVKAQNELAYKKAEFERKIATDNAKNTRSKSSSGSKSSSTNYTKALNAAAALGNDSAISKVLTDAATGKLVIGKTALPVTPQVLDNALASLGAKQTDTGWYDVTDWGKKDINPKNLEEAIARYAGIASSTGNNGSTSTKTQYPLFPTQQIAGNVEDGASKGLLNNVNSFLGVNIAPKTVADVAPEKKEEKVTPNTSLTQKLNNPGAVKSADPKDKSIMWKGQIGYDDQGHAKFDTPENGARAQAINLIRQVDKGATLTDLIKGNKSKGIGAYATGNQDGYINRVSKDLGIDPSKPLTADNVKALMVSMSKHEAGKDNPFTAKAIESGYKAAYDYVKGDSEELLDIVEENADTEEVSLNEDATIKVTPAPNNPKTTITKDGEGSNLLDEILSSPIVQTGKGIAEYATSVPYSLAGMLAEPFDIATEMYTGKPVTNYLAERGELLRDNANRTFKGLPTYNNKTTLEPTTVMDITSIAAPTVKGGGTSKVEKQLLDDVNKANKVKSDEVDTVLMKDALTRKKYRDNTKASEKLHTEYIKRTKKEKAAAKLKKSKEAKEAKNVAKDVKKAEVDARIKAGLEDAANAKPRKDNMQSLADILNQRAKQLEIKKAK